MKLYTEEELINYLRNHYDIITTYDLQNIPHIELPSDEEHQEEIDQSYRDGFEFALINECAKQSTSDASKYADGYAEGYKRALDYMTDTLKNKIEIKGGNK